MNPDIRKEESAFAKGEVSRLCIPPTAVSCHARRYYFPLVRAERYLRTKPRAANSVCLGSHMLASCEHIQRCAEKLAFRGIRGTLFTDFAPHSCTLVPLPKNSTSFDLSNFFIQAAGLAYHRRTTCGAYHQGRQTALVSHHALACIYLLLDDIQCSALMIYNGKPLMIYTPLA